MAPACVGSNGTRELEGSWIRGGGAHWKLRGLVTDFRSVFAMPRYTNHVLGSLAHFDFRIHHQRSLSVIVSG